MQSSAFEVGLSQSVVNFVSTPALKVFVSFELSLCESFFQIVLKFRFLKLFRFVVLCSIFLLFYVWHPTQFVVAADFLEF